MKTLSESIRSIQTSPRGDRSIVEQIEREVRASPSCITFDAQGYATLRAAGHAWAAGRFELPTLADLKTRVLARARQPQPKLTFSVLTGASPLSDVGALQGFAEEGTLFQVASQFDCLEARDACLAPIAEYLTDPTQGPRASISAFPGTFVRHYAAPRSNSLRFEQTEHEQLNLLEHFCRPGVAKVNCGYLQTENITHPAEFTRLLVDDFEQLRVGVHEGVEVVFGANWDGPTRSPAPRIAQVFTSTWAGGGYSAGELGVHHRTVLQQLQRGAYLGTLLAAAALGQRRVVLTLIGGGVFANPAPLIWDAIFWSLDELARVLPSSLEVVVNARTAIERTRLDEVRRRVEVSGGAFIDVERL